jgi:HlyD family secretion protein
MTRKPLLVAGLILLIVAGGAAAWWAVERNGAVKPLVLLGNVEIRQVNLAFKVAGRIASLGVDEGDRVEAGQVLASLEKSYFEDDLAQARAQCGQAEANLAKMEAGSRPEDIAQARAVVAEREATLANAQITLERAQRLLQTEAGTRRSFDDAQAAQREAAARLNSARQALRLQEVGFRQEDIDAARAQVAERRATVAQYERRLADAELVAPSPGVVLSRVRENGAIVSVGDTVYVLSLVSPVWVRTYVSEPDLGRVKPGMAVRVVTDGPGAPAFTGRVGYIAPTAEFTPKTVETRELRTALVYRLRVVVEDPGGNLRQGMPVTIDFAGDSPGDGARR